MASPAFTERQIKLTIQLGTGTFGESSSNTLGIGPISNQLYQGLRCSAIIQNAPTPFPGTAIITVWGLSLSHINQLTIAGLTFDGYRQNKIVMRPTMRSVV
jgi:hypothetical protein